MSVYHSVLGVAMKHCCPRGEGAGIYFAGNESRVCPRHYTPEQAALTLELDRNGASIGLRRDDGGAVLWPYGPNIDVASREAMVDWARAHGLKYAAGHHVLNCVCWPTSNRRSRCDCGMRQTQFDRLDSTWDHFTRWRSRKGGRAVLVAQPYQITDEGRAVLDEWNAREDTVVEICEESWYGHGTKFIGIWNAAFAPVPESA